MLENMTYDELARETSRFNLDEKGVEKIPTPTKGGVQNK